MSPSKLVVYSFVAELKCPVTGFCILSVIDK
jgi:hypothetical protein